MPVTVKVVTKADLAAVPLPTHGGKYTVVGHQFIFNEVAKELANKGFKVLSETYKSNLNGEIAQGVYHIEHGTDPEIKLMFAWANSYDKSMRFRCAIGAHVVATGSNMIAGDMSNYGRKHMGNATQLVSSHISSQISMADNYYNSLVADKEFMKTVTISEKELSELVGILYFKDDVMTSSQMITFKEAYKKNTTGNLWEIYSMIIDTFSKAHPKTWMEQQKNLHAIVKERYFPKLQEVDPNQTDLMEAIDQAQEESDVPQIPEQATTEEQEILSIDEYLGDPTPEVETDKVSEEILSESEPVEQPDIETPVVTKKDLICEAVRQGASSEELKDFTGQTDEPAVVEKAAQPGISKAPELELPSPPADVPVYSEQTSKEGLEAQLNTIQSTGVTAEQATETATNMFQELKETEEPAVPLDEQVAGTTVQPVTEQEKEVSAPPVVDAPKEDIKLTEEGKLQPNPNFEFEDSSNEGKLESPNFEF